MAINEKTRLARVTRWQGMKVAWKSKLDRAENQNDTDVANKMIAEADMMLSRLEIKDKDTAYPTSEVSKPTKKSKKDTDKYPLKINESADDKNIIGL